MQSHGFVCSTGIGFRLLAEETDYSRSVFSVSIESWPFAMVGEHQAHTGGRERHRAGQWALVKGRQRPSKEVEFFWTEQLSKWLQWWTQSRRWRWGHHLSSGELLGARGRIPESQQCHALWEHCRGQPSFADRTVCLVIILSSVKYFFIILLNLLLVLRLHAIIFANERLQLATNLLYFFIRLN